MGATPDEVRIPGVVFRGFRGFDEDIAGLAAANQALRDEAGMEAVVHADDMARDYAHLTNCDLTQDLLIAEREGRTVGYARCEWRDLTDGTRSFMTIFLVEPAQSGTGILAALLDWAEARLVAKAAAIPPDERKPSTMMTFTFASNTEAEALLEHRGWTRTGVGYEMVRPTLDDLPDVTLPEGLEVRSVGTDPVSLRAVWDAATEAFADERDEAAPTEEDWASFLEDVNQDPSLWAVAWDGDEIAGGVQGLIDPEENAHHGRERGLVDAVWTRRPWRRRGLARALIADVLRRLQERGMTSAYLGVDGLNPNDAGSLYRSLGFAPVSTSHDWRKPLPDLDAPLEDLPR